MLDIDDLYFALTCSGAPGSCEEVVQSVVGVESRANRAGALPLSALSAEAHALRAARERVPTADSSTAA